MDRTIRKTFISVVFIATLSLCADDQYDLFAAGNSAYQKGDFQKALDAYSAISQKGPAVWHNIGNCYFHQQDNLRALLCWRRALRGGRFSDYRKLVDKIERTERLLGIESYHVPFLIYLCPLWLSQIIFLAFWFLLWTIIKYKHQIKFCNWWIFGILVIVIFWTVVVYVQWRDERYQQAIVMTKDIVLYAGPDNGYDALGTVMQGAMVEVLDQRHGWYKIMGNEQYGWVMASVIEPIRFS